MQLKDNVMLRRKNLKEMKHHAYVVRSGVAVISDSDSIYHQRNR